MCRLFYTSGDRSRCLDIRAPAASSPAMPSKAFTKALLLYYKVLARRLRSLIIAHAPPPSAPSPPLPADGAVVACKVEGGLLMSSSTFPYFMLVALEAGGLLRGLLLLLLYPVLRLLRHGLATKVMVMVSFAGIRKDGFRIGRAVMPKLLMEDVSAEVFEAAAVPARRRRRQQRCVFVSGMPRPMVEPFLKEYLDVDSAVVVAPELREIGGYYLGLVEEEREVLRKMDLENVIGVKGGAGGKTVGIGGLGHSFHHLFQQYCEEVYVPTESARRRWRPLAPRRYPKPLVFHDGRTAFRPTPSATLAMYMWLPFGVLLAVLRSVVFIFLPFSLSVPLLAALGMHNRGIDNPPSSSVNLFACNHRSLLDPLYVSAAALRTDLSAATYSISRLSELLSPITTFRLTRDRAADRAAMRAQLSRPGIRDGGAGAAGLVVCPEGTTCREPFLLRFSPLFAELGCDVAPVALHSAAGMFHGTTAGGRKFLDPLYLLMNPVPSYIVQFLEPVKCGGPCGGADVANEVQRRIAEALGYARTELTRRDKYLILAGNEGVVGADAAKLTIY